MIYLYGSIITSILYIIAMIKLDVKIREIYWVILYAIFWPIFLLLHYLEGITNFIEEDK